MSQDRGPINCCDYGCNQSHNCPAHTKLYVKDGGARIDTGIPRAIPTVRTDWFLLILCWVVVTLFSATVALAVGRFI